MAKILLKFHCYCPMLLTWTTKTAVRLRAGEGGGREEGPREGGQVEGARGRGQKYTDTV